MPDRSDDTVLTDFSSAFTARTPLGAVARLSAVPTAEVDERAEMPAPRPRTDVVPVRIRWRRVLLLLALGAALVTPVVLRPFGGSVQTAVAAATGSRAPATSALPADRSATDGTSGGDAATATFAGVGQVELSLPAPEVTRIGYHEASFPNALALAPLGVNIDNQNTTKFTPAGAIAGPDYLVLSSRGRATPATSAVDIVMPDGVPVASVVDGQVSVVEPYLLYGRHPDTKIEIIPDARPDLRVVLIHVADVKVAPGDRVEAGRTVLAGTANRFPFSSHIDRYAEGTPEPHVHIEVKTLHQ